MRAAPLVLLLLLTTACGPSAAPTGQEALHSGVAPAASTEAARPTPAARTEAARPTPEALLAQTADLARSEGSVRFSAVVESGLDSEPTEVEARMSGALDTAGGAGTAQLEVVALAELVESAPPGEEAAAAELDALSQVRLSWTPEQVTLEAGGHRESVPRDPDDDQDGGLFERVPGEPAALLEIAAAADGVATAGDELVDGVATTHLTGEVDAATAVAAGLGTSAHLALAQLPTLPVDVWLDAAGRPLRIRYRAQVPSLQSGRTRTVVATYDYRDWGQPVDVTP